MIIHLITINLFNYAWQKPILVKYLPKSWIPYNFCFLMYNLHKLKIIMGIIMRKRGSNFNQIWQVKGYLLFFRSTQYVQNMGHPLTSWEGDVFRRYHVPQLFCFLESLFCDTQKMVVISRTSDSLWTNTVFIDVNQNPWYCSLKLSELDFCQYCFVCISKNNNAQKTYAYRWYGLIIPITKNILK